MSRNRPFDVEYTIAEFNPRGSDYCLLIPVINEGARILTELGRAQKAGIHRQVDIILCDGGSTDGSMNPETLKLYGVNTLLVKRSAGKQGAQLRMGLHFALNRGYKGVLTIDGNNKDSIEDVPRFVEKLRQGYDLVQGSRFVKGGRAIHTPPARWLAVRLIHAPVTSARPATGSPTPPTPTGPTAGNTSPTPRCSPCARCSWGTSCWLT